MKWVKGSFEFTIRGSEANVVNGYVSPDTKVFGIHQERNSWVITHLDSGMRAATTGHLVVAKQIVADLLEINSVWAVTAGVPDLTTEEIKAVWTIRRSGSLYMSKQVGTHLEKYLETKMNYV
jgi:hypothetical protein